MRVVECAVGDSATSLVRMPQLRRQIGAPTRETNTGSNTGCSARAVAGRCARHVDAEDVSEDEMIVEGAYSGGLFCPHGRPQRSKVLSVLLPQRAAQRGVHERVQPAVRLLDATARGEVAVVEHEHRQVCAEANKEMRTLRRARATS